MTLEISVGVNVLHAITVLLVLGSIPVFFTCCIANLIYVNDRRPLVAVGLLHLVLAWIGWPLMIAVMLWDPFDIAAWWMD